jgi:predicted ribonuclease YlaK
MFDIHELEVAREIIDTIYQDSIVQIDTLSPHHEAPINSYFILKSSTNSQQTALARYVGNKTFVNNALGDLDDRHQPVRPKDAKQSVFVDALNAQDIPINIAIGAAGTGKTTLAMVYAMDQYLTNNKKMKFTKPTSIVGRSRAFGAVPGDVDEKYDPYLASYKIVMEKLSSKKLDEHYFIEMKKRKDLEFVPIELARGCTFENCTFIIDEAQNLSWHELNTIVSRMGEGTTVIILGDLNQIDIRAPKEETGLYKLMNSRTFKGSTLSSSIELTTQYRSAICKLVGDVDKEVRNEEQTNYSR